MLHSSIKNAQSSVEFSIIVGAVLVAFITFLGILTQTIGTKNIEKRNTEFFELATSVQNELNIAAKTSNGYKRTFTIPDKIEGIDFTIEITAGSVYLHSEEGKYATSIPGQKVEGQLRHGQNIIRKEEGVICLNFEEGEPCPPTPPTP